MIISDSTKNIPLSTEKEFLEISIVAAENFMRVISWRCFHKLNRGERGEKKEWYGLKSTNAYPKLIELNDFAKDFAKLVQNIKFKDRRNTFLSYLGKVVKEVRSKEQLIIAADKTSNKYLVAPAEYNRFLRKEVEKGYRKADYKEVDNVRIEQNDIAEAMGIEDRLFGTQEKEAFITLKDHKEDFGLRASVRLINPAKNELGKVAMKMLKDMIRDLKFETRLKQCISTGEVLKWFRGLEGKKDLKFIIFDVEAFYPSITEELFNRALDWAATITDVTSRQRQVFLKSCKSFLFCGGEAWTKKGRTNFDVGMGAYQGAQVCEIVGLFLLQKLRSVEGLECILYRDDGLGITRAGPRTQDGMRKKIQNIFKEQGLGITITVNLKSVNFLDVNMDLETGIYKPFRKPGDIPKYVSASSNHPPDTIKGIPGGVERRLNENSSNEEVFNNAKVLYQNELKRCGYSHDLTYKRKEDQEVEQEERGSRRRRSRRVTWYNPPFSVGVATNMKKEFLNLVDKHFVTGHCLREVMNRTAIRVSYQAMPNLGAKIASHNCKVMREEVKKTQKEKGKKKRKGECNCQISRKAECPTPGMCNTDGVIYQALVKTNDGGEETYVGLAKNFKKQFRSHRRTLATELEGEKTTLSTYFWKMEEEEKEPIVTWKFLETGLSNYNPITKACQLCLREKYIIVFEPEKATLNSRTEMYASCRHKKAKLLGKPPERK